MSVKQVSNMAEAVIDRRLITDKTDSRAANQIQFFIKRSFDPKFDWFTTFRHALHPQSTEPPLTLRISPLIWRAHSVQRKTIGQPMSSGAATRPTGIPSSIDLRYPG